MLAQNAGMTMTRLRLLSAVAVLLMVVAAAGALTGRPAVTTPAGIAGGLLAFWTAQQMRRLL
jgi:hypothetical protein